MLIIQGLVNGYEIAPPAIFGPKWGPMGDLFDPSGVPFWVLRQELGREGVGAPLENLKGLGTYELRQRILDLDGGTHAQGRYTFSSWRTAPLEWLQEEVRILERDKLARRLDLGRIAGFHSPILRRHLRSGLLAPISRARSQVHRRKLTDEQVQTIRQDWNGVTVGCPSLAKKYGVCVNTITRILKGQRYK